MSQRAIIKRHYLLINILERKGYVSQKEILSIYSEEGLKCSRSTFTRTLESLRDDFGIEVTYSSSLRGYYIDKEKSINVESFSNLLRYYNSTDHISKAFSSAYESHKYIQIDSSSLMRGIEHLPIIVDALNKKDQLKLTYSKFEDEESICFYFNPEILKEYQNRWYIVGFSHLRKGIRTYALDRIEKVDRTSKTFTRTLDRADDYFRDIIGVDTSGRSIEKVVLSFSKQQSNYIKTLPLHYSQEVIVDNAEELRITINVKPNYELKQRIQMYGDEVKIIHPKDLLELCN